MREYNLFSRHQNTTKDWQIRPIERLTVHQVKDTFSCAMTLKKQWLWPAKPYMSSFLSCRSIVTGILEHNIEENFRKNLITDDNWK